MDVLVGLGFALLIITLIGHGIWVFVAFLIRQLAEGPTGPPKVSAETKRQMCPGCGRSFSGRLPSCPWCGTIATSDKSTTPLQRLREIEQQLDRLSADAAFPPEQFVALRRLLREAESQLVNRPAVKTIAPADSEPSFTTSEPPAPPTTSSLEQLLADVKDVAAVSQASASAVPALEPSPGTAAPPKRKQSAWSDLLQTFLEEKNIRWGELLAGLLIVGSSVGLVISLWSTLRNAIPYFPALVFLAVTAAIHGAGLYTLRHWRLKATSRGLLTIALLLVPLNFLAAIALSEQRAATDPLYLTAVTIGVLAYGWIVWSGARELLRFGAGWLSLAVMGSSIGQLVIGRETAPGLSLLPANGLLALPLISFVVASLGESLFAARWRRVTSRRAEGLYRQLGMSFFAFVVATGLLVWKSQAVLGTLSLLSPSLSLAAAMIVGLASRLLPRKFVVPPLGGMPSLPLPRIGGEGRGEGASRIFETPLPLTPEAKEREQKQEPPEGGTANTVAATAVTLVGAMLMVVAMVLAWPVPERLIAVGLVNFVALSWFGFATRLAPLHFPALECLALAGLVAFHQFGGAIGGAGVSGDRNLLATILLGRSAVVVSLMSLATAGLAGGLWKALRRDDAKSYLAAAAGMAVLSLGIAGYAGFWPHGWQMSLDRSLITAVFLLYAVAVLVANEWLRRIELTWAGAVLWLAVFVHGLGWNEFLRDQLRVQGLLPDRPIVFALLAYSTWTLLCAIVGRVRDRFAVPWSAASGRATVVAFFLMPWHLVGAYGTHAGYLGWIAALCLGQAHLWQSRNVFSLGQFISFLAVALGTTAFAQQQDWWTAYSSEWEASFDPRHAHYQFIALALACVPWVFWRRLGGLWATLARCCAVRVDRVVMPLLTAIAAAWMWLISAPSVVASLRKLEWSSTDGLAQLILLLIGWGTACWALEPGTRRWFAEIRRRPIGQTTTAAIRLPWLVIGLTLLLDAATFGLRSIFEPAFGVHSESLNVRLLVGPSAWWAMSSLGVCWLVICWERHRRLPIIGLVAVGWILSVMLPLDRMLQGMLNVVGRRAWPLLEVDLVVWLTSYAGIVWLSLHALAWKWPLRFGGIASRYRRNDARLSDVCGVLGWLCLWPIVALITLKSLPQWGSRSLGSTWLDLAAVSGPLLMWTVLLFEQARRERSTVLMFASSQAWCLATVLFAFIVFPVRPRWHSLGWELGWSSVALGVFSLWWTRQRSDVGPSPSTMWHDRWRRSEITPALWQQLWSWGCVLLPSLVAAWSLFVHAGRGAAKSELPLSVTASGLVGHVGWALVVIATVVAASSSASRLHVIGLGTLIWVPVLAQPFVSAEIPWQAFNGWMLGWVALACGWTAAAWWCRGTFDKLAARWADVASAGVIVLAVREFVPHANVACPASGIGIVAVLAAVLAINFRSQPRVAVSIVGVLLATAMGMTHDWRGLRPSTDQQWVNWAEACLASLGLAALAWQIVEVWWQRFRGERFGRETAPAAAHVAATVALVAAVGFVLVELLIQTVQLSGGFPPQEHAQRHWLGLGGWSMLAVVVASWGVAMWDRFAKHVIAGLYGCLRLTLLMAFGLCGLRLGDGFWVSGEALFAVQVALVGGLWWVWSWFVERRDAQLRLATLGALQSSSLNQQRLAWTTSLVAGWKWQRDEAQRWLPNMQLLWSAFVVFVSLVVVLTFASRELRLCGAASCVLLVPGLAALGCARGTASRQRELFQQVALGLGAVCVLDFVWAWMEPRPTADFWLQRSIRALEAFAVTAFVYGVGLVRVLSPKTDWRAAVQRSAMQVGATAAATLVVVLSLEAYWFDPVNGCPITGAQIAIVAATLVALAGALLSLALLPGTIELVMRQRCVIVAEVVIALLFLHCYLAMPELFRGFFQPYWPFVVMAIAFIGVGAGELCQRNALPVLSEPLRQTGALLPLIPALGFWVATSRTNYSAVLFVVGLAYVWLSMQRRSFWYVLAASLAGNAGLWSMWSEHGLTLLARPQMWLIPPAVSVLAAAQWNRRRLTDTQLTAIRYPAIMLIYVSSAGEMFLTGIAESWLLPMVLMLLSVVGVMAGIWLRVRAFMYLGASFLLLSLVSLVWHAAEAIEHTWPWWAFGIGLGLGILALFGLFERKRNEMRQLLDEVRGWEQ